MNSAKACSLMRICARSCSICWNVSKGSIFCSSKSFANFLTSSGVMELTLGRDMLATFTTICLPFCVLVVMSTSSICAWNSLCRKSSCHFVSFRCRVMLCMGSFSLRAACCNDFSRAFFAILSAFFCAFSSIFKSLYIFSTLSRLAESSFSTLASWIFFSCRKRTSVTILFSRFSSSNPCVASPMVDIENPIFLSSSSSTSVILTPSCARACAISLCLPVLFLVIFCACPSWSIISVVTSFCPIVSATSFREAPVSIASSACSISLLNCSTACSCSSCFLILFRTSLNSGIFAGISLSRRMMYQPRLPSVMAVSPIFSSEKTVLAIVSSIISFLVFSFIAIALGAEASLAIS